MTKRQRMLGVTDYGYQRGIVQGEFLADLESFLAKIATVKKGQYFGRDVAKMFFAEECKQQGEWLVDCKFKQMQPFLVALTVIMPTHIYYANTHGLDCLNIQ